MHAPTFVADLATVLLVASFTGLLFRKLGQPSVLGYLLAGLIVGPYIPIPIFADPERIHALSEVGVVLVMFVVGLELRLERLARVLPTAGPMTLIEVTALLGTGYGIGRALGWDTKAAVFLGASIAISSTMLVSKVFEDRDVGEDVREHVMSMLVIQDVLAIVLAAVLTAVAAGEGLNAEAIGGVVGKLAFFLGVILIVGLLVVPRLVRFVVGLQSVELLVVVCMGLCFGLALAAEAAGFSVALGAFFAGTLVAESGKGETVEHLASPLRDTFAAIFFVAIGMTVDPRVAFTHLGTSLLVFVAVVVAQLVAVGLSGVLSGNGARRSVTAGLSLGQVGEFGFILSAIGINAGLAPPELGPIVVTVAVLTAFSTPLALRSADGVVRALDHALPQKLQDVSSLYEQWLEAFRARETPERSPITRAAWIAALDGIAATGVVVAAASFRGPLAALVRERLGVEPPWDAVTLWSATIALALLPTVAFVRAARSLGVHTAERIFGPLAAQPKSGRPRRLLEVAIQLLVVLAVGIPCAVIALPFAGGTPGTLLKVDTRLGAMQLVPGVEPSVANAPIGVRRSAVVELDEPYLFLLGSAPGGRESLIRSLHLPYGERWARSLPLPPDEVYDSPPPLPAQTATSVVLAFSDPDRARATRGASRTSLQVFDRASGVPRDLRVLDDLGRADSLELVPFGPALLVFGRNALVILSRE